MSMKNLYLPPDASPERRRVQAEYVAAAIRLTSTDDVDALEAYRKAEREFGRLLLEEDKARRPEVYGTPIEMPLKGVDAGNIVWDSPNVIEILVTALRDARDHIANVTGARERPGSDSAAIVEACDAALRLAGYE